MTRDKKQGNAAEENTRQKIMAAAGEVFAEYGFDGASVRTITQRAGVNVAAINYHFRDKSELYARVIVDTCCSRRVVDEVVSHEAEEPEQKLRSIIFSLLEYLLDPDRPEWHRRLMARELTNPTYALDQLVEMNIKPLRDRCLLPVLNELAKGQLDKKKLRLIANSIMGQCHYYLQSKPILDRLYPDLKIGKPEIKEIAGHITQFSLAAVLGLSTNAKKTKKQ
jgi:TetR/AcrR family transcriptional regulator, regulator of cefoperazone and chloramphenicol sensitivity